MALLFRVIGRLKGEDGLFPVGYVGGQPPPGEMYVISGCLWEACTTMTPSATELALFRRGARRNGGPTNGKA